ncbi:MAG: hypothetical protein HYX40_06390 [Sphingobacteriales bacterium]|nr:hypothetical protein [Sphingobacteriales bacterium]
MVLKQHDIEIFNWLLDRQQNQYKIVKSKGVYLELIDYNKRISFHPLSELEGIKINEHNLSVSGFKASSDNYWYHQEMVGFVIFKVQGGPWQLHYKGQGKIIFCIHELQNAFYLLTNTTLEINLYGII